MNIIQKVILYSLFMSFGTPLLVKADHEEIIILCGNDEEEIYPIEDTDTICTIAEIQNYIDDLEFDPSVPKNNSIELGKNIDLQDEKEASEIIIVDVAMIPVAPDDIIILGQNSLEEAIDDFVAAIDDQVEFATDNIETDNIQEIIAPQETVFLTCEEQMTNSTTEEPKVIEAETIVVVDVVIPVQENKIDDTPASNKNEKKKKKGLFNRSKKSKDKN